LYFVLIGKTLQELD